MADQILDLGVGNNDIDHPADGQRRHAAFTAVYLCAEKGFEILVTDDPPPGCDGRETALEIAMVDEVEKATEHDGTDPEATERQLEVGEKISAKILEIAAPTILKLASPVPGAPLPTHPMLGVRTIQDILFPVYIKLQLVTRNGRLELIPGHHKHGQKEDRSLTLQEVRDCGFDDLDTFPTCPASEVLLTSRHQSGGFVYDASVSGILAGSDLVCKVLTNWFRKPFIRELQTLSKLRNANLDSEVRVSTIKGFVTHGGGIQGVLLEKIPTKYGILDLAFRDKTPDSIPPLSLRQKWADQIEHTVTQMHSHGIIWGDAKSLNIIIDKEDNAWVIDFGGGFTTPWVEFSMMDTVEGDLHALAIIKRDLLLGVCTARD